MTDFAVSRNPTTGDILASYPMQNTAELEQALSTSAAAFKKWRKSSMASRVTVLRQLGHKLREREPELTRMITLEMGKPVAQARAEILKCANLCDWYAEFGPAMLEDKPSQVPDAWQSFRPIGVILAVMPWNFPFWQVLRGAVGMLLAGNTYLLKHAPNVMGSATLMAELFDATDLPKGGFNLINVDNEGVSTAIKDDRIAAVAVTGSVRAGAAIAAQAGAALKKTVLELGGSDPFIVLADADLDEAIKSAVTGRYQNTGQVCMAAKRFIIEASIAEAFEARFVEAVKALKIGDPLNEDTYIGPMARADLRDELDQQVQASLREGARLVLGGEKIAGQGNYYAPTILSDVTSEMTAFRQELFGPVAAIAVARDAEHALEIANNSDFGLSATVWTGDEHMAARMSEELEVGAVFINGNGASDPRVTIGGVKKSGYGRELSHFGVHEFCNVQTIWKNRQ
ncbi:aldehyde dehydrogenase family protein [Pantoea ananatis]|uniref:aldehyde dehydrogenase family protein n=2 Tax=Pantoea ananas TaxID=553 RepID=UPI00099BE723|nr:aldehyde dehydrogenase family protein [Pantoea ananatis]MDR6091520.1 succinate-semialdehyde dehydrogenase [Pantoea ananatis]PQK91276.1 succinate-semialdehyde dehydrogenase [Pantoea ananatis]PQL06001.1 succinate-semialdehyde dehydrogenase [Pantoea ananatis]PWV63662.1 succinate-semialdehyde dehydrogenase [Pantoea ananatis]SKA77192.1 succinate-semialdehyde dehydrogenase [Pantoea ananatis]